MKIADPLAALLKHVGFDLGDVFGDHLVLGLKAAPSLRVELRGSKLCCNLRGLGMKIADP
eukprot:CAMPEP_0181282744 /NCGR_PEP_ID=MMETSP1097-20121128/14379_1 /TAXON_ID=35684 /ORGANISM="Pseudopedinella elastica, Strain CCMP716" /LENGTH=59 /DNA_ID=CAMNT_0023385823 /DNA_START=45 /DNA_END=221 /DNA_ORIENTATION=+